MSEKSLQNIKNEEKTGASAQLLTENLSDQKLVSGEALSPT